MREFHAARKKTSIPPRHAAVWDRASLAGCGAGGNRRAAVAAPRSEDTAMIVWRLLLLAMIWGSSFLFQRVAVPRWAPA